MPGTAPLLECRDLRKRFGDRTAVAGISFTISPGETYGLLGPNGAGKTTTISMVCGLLRRDGGEVIVDGRPIDIDATDAKAAIGQWPRTWRSTRTCRLARTCASSAGSSACRGSCSTSASRRSWSSSG